MKIEDFSPVSKGEEHLKITSYKEKASAFLQQLLSSVSTFALTRFPCDFCCEAFGLCTSELIYLSQHWALPSCNVLHRGSISE